MQISGDRLVAMFLAAVACLAAAGPAPAAGARPATQASGPVDSIVVTGSVDGNGTLHDTVRVVLEGVLARGLRAIQAQRGAEGVAGVAGTLADRVSPTGRAEDVAVRSWAEPAGGYRFTFTSSVRNYLTPDADLQQTGVPLPAFPLPDPAKGQGGALSLGAPQRLVDRVRVTLPRRLVALPDSFISDSTSFARFTAWRPGGGPELREIRTLRILRAAVDPGARDTYRAFVARVDSASRRPVTVVPRRVGGDTPFVVRTSDSTYRLVRAGYPTSQRRARPPWTLHPDLDAPLRVPMDVPMPIDTRGDRDPRLDNPRTMRKLLQRDYPTYLERRRIGGRVLLWLWVETDGRPSEILVRESSGQDALDFAAARVATHMRFRPARHHGEPIAVWIAQPVTFTVRSSF